jgi:hypothetical protein
MKHLFSLLTLGWMATMAWAQTDTYLYLQINADGAADEDIVVVTLETQPALLDGTSTLTLLGDNEQLVMLGLPMGTMQGTVTASFEDCQGNPQTAQTYMSYTGADSSGITLLWAELELPYCDSEEEEFEGWDEDLDLDALEAYLDSLCGQVFNPDAQAYCDLLQSIVDCMNGDTLACLEVEGWLDNVEWTWQDDEEEEEEEIESDCNAEFTVMQAFGNDSLPISNLLWVYVYDYDDSNDYFWSFGDEGTSTDPFPTWNYETDGPYELCLTVSNEEDSCSNTFCQTLSVDSAGWWTGLVDGFTINVFDAGTGGSVSDVTLAPESAVTLSLYPNPVQNGILSVEWTTNASSAATIDVLGLDGRVMTTRTWSVAPGAQRTFVDVSSLASGIYLVRLTGGNHQRTQRVVIR